MKQLPKIAVLTVFYENNINDYFLRYFNSLDKIINLKNNSFKIKVFILDNSKVLKLNRFFKINQISLNSNSYSVIEKEIAGFAAGNNFLFNLVEKTYNPDYIFLLNPDTEIKKNCIDILLKRITSSDKIFCVEAKQYPFEHPKWYDKNTLETSWCSGACLLINATSFKYLDGFDEIFQMYVEDVDLSWRALNHGFNLLYEPLANVVHHTYGLNKNQIRRQYWSIKNNIIMRYKFGGLNKIFDGIVLVTGIAIQALKRRKIAELTNITSALITGLIDALLRAKRIKLSKVNNNITFNGFNYGCN